MIFKEEKGVLLPCCDSNIPLLNPSKLLGRGIQVVMFGCVGGAHTSKHHDLLRTTND